MKAQQILSTCLFLTFLVGTASAGLMIKEQDEDDVTTQIYQDGIVVILAQEAGNQAVMIIDTRKSQCTWFNHLSRQFARSDCAAPSEVAGEMLESFQEHLSPEQLAMMQGMRDQEMERQMPPLQVKKIGGTNFQNYAVDKYHFLVEGRPVAEVWLSPDVGDAISKEVNFEAMNQLFGDQANEDHFSTFDSQDPSAVLEQKIEELSEKERAYVIKSMQIMEPGGTSNMEIFGSQVIEIKTGSFDLSQYRAPSDYKEVGSINELMQGAWGQ